MLLKTMTLQCLCTMPMYLIEYSVIQAHLEVYDSLKEMKKYE